MSHGLFEEKVFLNEEEHKYTDKNGQQYIGFSTFSSLFYPVFMKDHIAQKTADSKGINKEDVLAEWQSKTDNGSRIDKALTLKAKGFTLTEEYADVEKLVDNVLLDYKDYHSTYEQVVVYNEQYKLAGSPDKFMLSSGRKDARFYVSDFKCFEDQNLHEHRGWLLSPFEHLPKTKYVKIALQVSYYAVQLEALLGKKCGGLFIHLIDPINHTHKQIPVPYLKNDIIIALEVHKEKILSLTYNGGSYSAF